VVRKGETAYVGDRKEHSGYDEPGKIKVRSIVRVFAALWRRRRDGFVNVRSKRCDRCRWRSSFVNGC
jgi:hypothetical protein